ncbi:TPA: DUF86 domain-containing protein [Candidatus Woesearchaeota archaeon]|nr:DUF86 domain-containing protein [Candidatus Woesearchaeota archaeon]
MKKNSVVFLQHILDNIQKVESFSKNISRQELTKNLQKQYAIVRAIEIIGEAARNIPADVKKRYPEISWNEIVGTRDVLIHHYFGVDLNIVWDIIKKNLPVLKEQIKKIKSDLE